MLLRNVIITMGIDIIILFGGWGGGGAHNRSLPQVQRLLLGVCTSNTLIITVLIAPSGFPPSQLNIIFYAVM